MRKKNNQTFRGLSDTVSELALIPGDSKKACGLSVKVGAYEAQGINGILAGLIHSRSSGSLNSSCGYFPGPRM